jgi:hypothetical protein
VELSGEGLLLDVVADAVLVVLGDIVVVVPWAAAGMLGCTSASQLRRAVKPTTNTSTTTVSVSTLLLPILSTFYVSRLACR